MNKILNLIACALKKVFSFQQVKMIAYAACQESQIR